MKNTIKAVALMCSVVAGSASAESFLDLGNNKKGFNPSSKVWMFREGLLNAKSQADHISAASNSAIPSGNIIVHPNQLKAAQSIADFSRKFADKPVVAKNNIVSTVKNAAASVGGYMAEKVGNVFAAGRMAAYNAKMKAQSARFAAIDCKNAVLKKLVQAGRLAQWKSVQAHLWAHQNPRASKAAAVALGAATVYFANRAYKAYMAKEEVQQA